MTGGEITQRRCSGFYGGLGNLHQGADTESYSLASPPALLSTDERSTELFHSLQFFSGLSARERIKKIKEPTIRQFADVP